MKTQVAIRKRMQALGISADELAARIGVDPVTFRESLLGRRDFGPEFGAVCAALGLDYSDFPSSLKSIDWSALQEARGLR